MSHSTKFSVLLLTIGIPGSGKTTWVNKFKKAKPNGTYVVSTDEIRKEITGIEQCVDPSQNDFIHSEARKRVKKLLDQTDDLWKQNGTWPFIIVDSTNVNEEEWKEYRKLGASVMIAKVFKIKPEEAFEQIKNRERKVPLPILQMKWDILQKNQHLIPKYFNLIW